MISLLFASTIVSLAQRLTTIHLRKNQVLVVDDSLVIAKRDTTVQLARGTEYEVYDNKYVLSEGFYDSVYTSAQKSRITKELYNLLIVNRPPDNTFQNTDPVNSEDFFKAFEGKTITSIDYVSVDLFGGSVNDTTLKANSRIGRISNKIHIDSKKHVIFKQLLFDVGDEVDAFEMADTERIIRSLKYIEDARIILKVNTNDLNTVKATVVIKDRFPWSLDAAVDNSSTLRVGFINQNIVGTGNEFGIDYLYSKNIPPSHGYDAHYTIRNIDDSFIDGTVYFSDNYLGKSKGISFRRGFISPAIKYYGEATIEHVQPIVDLTFADSVYEEGFQIDRRSYDLWSARAFQLGEKRKNISAALRIKHDNYTNRPEVRADSNNIYQDHHFLVSGLSYSKINYLKTKNILSFNITEDVPVGFIYSAIYGRDWTEFGTRNYRGIRTIYANYNKRIGYFLLNLESGYFTLNKQKVDQVIQFNGRHFTPLIDLGTAHSRVFTRFHYFNSNNLSIPLAQSLLGENRIRNIEGSQISGNNLFTLTTEYVVFQPWYFYGFRFATYVHAGIGSVSESRNFDPYDITYYTYGGGVRIRNESLVFDTFEFRVAFLPTTPADGQSFHFKVSLSAPQFFRSPNIAKPQVVGLK
ncbi:hypothetical protein SAMN05421640_0916 [Ekhidna lutea]|uniref:Outer membrane protein assembly factor BamA n=1 Tax=Ekhidna lutea TaxID=447679 RepID=A0A239GP34_EKHLU|nr:hypothetical protein [Ekhidna lutea]SNS70253.1 hypothetical protein SAMN05421640_0916 [Ekhidna lutea]